MNKIEFKVLRKNNNDLCEEYDAVRIFIDGKDLIDILREFEMPFAKKEDCENNAGSYEGMTPECLYENLTSEPIYEDNKTVVLECVCRCSGCWDFLTEIKENENNVIWTNFENNHRGPESHNFWDYSSFKDLLFDKENYKQEIEKLKTFITDEQQNNE